MRDDLRRAVDLVRGGATFSSAAKEVGVTRNAVAGAAFRAGVKSCSGVTASDMAKKQWAGYDPCRRKQITEKRLRTIEEKKAAAAWRWACRYAAKGKGGAA